MELDEVTEYTETGAPLGYRYPSIHDIPVDIRPLMAAKALRNYPKGPTGTRGPGARTGRDLKTFWCLSCDTPVKTNKTTWCKECNDKRDGKGRQKSRAEAAGRPTTVTMPIGALEKLLRLSDSVVSLIGAATVEFDRPHMTGGAIDDLMLATKQLADYLSREIHPEVQKAKHPTVRPEDMQRTGRRQIPKPE